MLEVPLIFVKLLNTREVCMAINRSELISIIKELKEDIGSEFTLGFGGVLVLNGIRDLTNDADVDVENHVFDKLAKKHKVKRIDFDRRKVEIIEHSHLVDIHRPMTDARRVYNFQYRVWCLTLDYILEQKMKWNRPKDQADITALKKILMVE